MMSSNDTASAACAFLALMVSPMRSDFGGFCGRSTGGVSDYGAAGENRQRSTIRCLLRGAFRRRGSQFSCTHKRAVIAVVLTHMGVADTLIRGSDISEQ